MTASGRGETTEQNNSALGCQCRIVTPVGLAMGIYAVALRVPAASEDVDAEHVERLIGRTQGRMVDDGG